MDSELDLLPLFELVLCRCKQPVPVMVKSRAVVGFPCSSEKQWIMVIKIFESFVTVRVIFRSFCPNVAEQMAIKAGGKVDGLFLAPSAPFVFHERPSSMLGGPVAPNRHLDDLTDPCTGLSNQQ